MDDEELEEIRRKMRKKLLEKEAGEEEAVFLGQNLEPEARQRLSNLKLIKPELVRQVEQYLTELIRSERVIPPITDSQLKQLLLEIQSRKREQKIRYK